MKRILERSMNSLPLNRFAIKMNWKEFLKPTAGKMILFLVLIVATSIPSNLFMEGADLGANHGYPLNFYGYGGGPPLPASVWPQIASYFHIHYLILNIIIWYLISCIIVLAYTSLRRKK